MTAHKFKPDEVRLPPGRPRFMDRRGWFRPIAGHRRLTSGRRFRSHSGSSAFPGDQRQKSREPCLDVFPPEAGRTAVAAIDLPDQPGFAQHPEVMGERGLADGKVEGRAGALRPGRCPGEFSDDPPPQRIGECREHRAELDLVQGGMSLMIRHCHPRYDLHRTLLQVR